MRNSHRSAFFGRKAGAKALLVATAVAALGAPGAALGGTYTEVTTTRVVPQRTMRIIESPAPTQIVRTERVYAPTTRVYVEPEVRYYVSEPVPVTRRIVRTQETRILE